MSDKFQESVCPHCREFSKIELRRQLAEAKVVIADREAAANSYLNRSVHWAGVATELATALRELSQASLRSAQCWNDMDSNEGVAGGDIIAARQGLDVARKKANALLAKLATGTEPAMSKD